MSFRDQSIESFLTNLSSKAPIPGGGGASALCGALSTSLAHMVAALTVGKPKYAAVETQMNELLTRADALQERFLELMDEDATAFEPLALAYRLPKETEEQKAEKARRMELALKSAVQPPIEIMERCKDALELISICAKSGTVVAVSDAGVAATLCRAALEGAAMNVFINTQSMQDRTYAEAQNKRAKELLAEYCPAAEAITNEVFLRLCD